MKPTTLRCFISASALAGVAAAGNAVAAPPDALVAAAKQEGQLTVIALPHDWCGYGPMISDFQKNATVLNRTNLNVSGVYRKGGTAGASTGCSASQVLKGATVSGGIITAGTCASGGSKGVGGYRSSTK